MPSPFCQEKAFSHVVRSGHEQSLMDSTVGVQWLALAGIERVGLNLSQNPQDRVDICSALARLAREPGAQQQPRGRFSSQEQRL